MQKIKTAQINIKWNQAATNGDKSPVSDHLLLQGRLTQSKTALKQTAGIKIHSTVGKIWLC